MIEKKMTEFLFFALIILKLFTTGRWMGETCPFKRGIFEIMRIR